MRKLKLCILFFVLSFSATYAQLPAYQVIPLNSELGAIRGYYHDNSLIDFDNDGLLDVFSANNAIFKNGGNNLFTRKVDLPYFYDCMSTDMDNDNDIDFVGNSLNTIFIYENKGNFSFTPKQIFDSKDQIERVNVVDLDNDGKKDLLINLKGETIILKNEGNLVFSQKKILPYITTSVIYFDSDDKYDLVVTTASWEKRVLKNKGNFEFSTQSISEELKNTLYYPVQQYDFNADGKLDLLGPSNVYFNQGNNTYTPVFSIMNAPSFHAAPVDMDNNGYLDLSCSYNQKVYLNKGNTSLEETDFSSTSGTYFYGDLNNDNRTDALAHLFSMSADYGTVMFQNTSSTPNTPPTFPTNLNAVANGDSITFSWDRATDKETPMVGLTYNLRVGTTPGGCDIMSDMTASNGRRLVLEQGNVMQNLSWTLHNVKAGNFYWSVEAIDNSYLPSARTIEQKVAVLKNHISPIETATLQTNRKDLQWVVIDSIAPETHQWKMGLKIGEYHDIAGENGTTCSPSFSQAGTYYLVCESRLENTKVISNAVKINVFAPEISINGTIPTCSISRQNGSTFTINYNLVGKYESDNQFTAYLSDKNGDFTNETKLNSVISNTNGIFTVNLPAGTPDGSNYKIRLKSNNPQATSNASNQFIVDLNDPPTGIRLTNHVEENLPIGTAFTTLKAIDDDLEDTFIYTSLTNSTNFYIEGNSLRTSRIFDYETEPTVYTFAIKITDNHNTSCIQTFNIDIDNVNEPPTLDLPSQTFAGLELGDISITGFTINDVDAFNNPLDVTVSSNDGLLKFEELPKKRSSKSIEFEGTLSQINSLINSMVFQSDRYFYGNAIITINISDLGNSGSGGIKTVEKTIKIDITALPPQIIVQPVPLIKGCVNDMTGFSISADGAQPIEYQWFKNESILYSEKNNFIRFAIKNDEDAGAYYCKVKNPGGEVVSEQGILLVKAQDFRADIADIKLCSGDPAGEISVTATGGWGDYQYSIDNGNHYFQTQVFKNLQVGLYHVVIKDNNNCTTTKDFFVQAPPLLRPNVNPKNISCKDYKNGELNINVLGGTPPFSIDIQSNSLNAIFTFNTNQDHQMYKNLIPDLYTINIKDKNACDTFAVIRLTEPDKLSFTSQTRSVRCFGEHNGELNFTIEGGTEPYWFYWTNKEMTNLIKDFESGSYNLATIAKTEGLAAGKYEFYVTDSQSCQTSENTEITSPTLLESSFVDNTLLAKGGTLPYEYSENGRSFSSNNRFDNLSTGLHTLSVRDSKGCLSSISQYVENKPITGTKPSVDFQFVSQGSIVTLSSTIKNAKNWIWDFGDGTSTSEDVNHHTYSKSGTYKVSLTAYNEFGSSVIEKTIQIIVTNIGTEIESDFMLYPNPATDEVFISCTSTKSLIISILDASGRKVKEEVSHSTLIRLSVKDLSKGFYIVKIGNTSKKLIIR